MNKNIIFALGFISGAICGIAGTYYTLKSKYEADLDDSDYLMNINEEEEKELDIEHSGYHKIIKEEEKEATSDELLDFNYRTIENGYTRYYLVNKPDPEDILAEREAPIEEIGAEIETKEERMERIANEDAGKKPEIITFEEYNDPDHSHFEKEMLIYEKISGDFSTEEGNIVDDPYILLGEDNIDPAEHNVFDQTPTDDYVYVRNYAIGVDYMIHITELPEEAML